ncbi:hypothetical protein VTJ49DRAFT_2202 [Mycothermus thermophilus]|uniref:Sulfhydryl oxidase n=1 Tax=Humicola insolens TaxID=85995 RepID=A0ABR3VAE7_HUMIN
MARRQHITLSLLAAMVFLSLTYVMTSRSGDAYSPLRVYDEKVATDYALDYGSSSSSGKSSSSSSSSSHDALSGLSDNILQGGSIAPKLENATIKAELGRASWKLFHTMMARFPEKPTPDDSLALKTYIQLFARLYPCGDCAAHFRKLLERYPPQTGSRNAAAGWACFVHNQVNKRLGKQEFDCNKIGDFYDCGCGDEDGNKKNEELKGRDGLTLEMEEGLVRGG